MYSRQRTKLVVSIISFSVASMSYHLWPRHPVSVSELMPLEHSVNRSNDSALITKLTFHARRFKDTMIARQFRELIVRPVTNRFPNPQDAEEMLMFTGAVESELAEYIRQTGTDGNYSVGRGPFQMEPETYHWLAGIPAYSAMLAGRDPDDMVWDFRLATLAARLRYHIVRENLPTAGDVDGMAAYWKKWYNGNSPAGLTVEQAKAKYLRLVKGIR